MLKQLPCLALILLALPVYGDWLDGQTPVKRPNSVTPAAQPLPLESVRLTDSDFLHVQNLEKAYLLSASPDRFLVKFRSEAGLPPKPGVEVYGGWEGNTPLAGHSFGHYISAAAMMYASTGDERLKAKVDQSIAGLAEVQAAHDKDPRWTGYLCAIPGGKDLFEATAAGDVELMGKKWIVPFYTQHKIMSGLLDAYRYCGNETALKLAIGHADWMFRFFNPLTDEQFQRMLRTEFGGIADPLLQLYSITGEKKYFDLALRFQQEKIVEPWKNQIDNLPGIHANTTIPKADVCAKIYEITGDKPLGQAAEFFWNTVVFHHSYITGGNSDREHFGQPDKLDNRFNAPTETCNTYNMLKLTEHLYSWNPNNPDYFDYYERALYNHILGAFNHHVSPENGFADGLTCYFIHFQPGSFKRYDAPYDAFTCCFGTGMENPSKYGGNIYWRNNDSSALYVNLFIPSRLNWSEQGIQLEQKTDFPATGQVEIAIKADRAAQFTLKTRIPFWTGKTGYQDFPIALKSGETTTIRLDLPMSLRTQSMPDNPRRVGIFYGPTLLTADLGPVNSSSPRVQRDSQWAKNGPSEPLEVPALVSTSDAPTDWLAPVEGAPLRFTAKPGAFTYNGLTFLPFYQLHGRINCIFFDRYTAQQWDQYKADLAEKRRQEQLLIARTIDAIAPGEMQAERDHQIASDKSDVGDFNGRKFRHAVDGGWFSYELKVDPTVKNELVCTYWGSDAGNRSFDVLVDGQLVAQVQLNRDAPDKFFQSAIQLDKKLLDGKDKITVRFQAKPGNFAGGLFGIALLRVQ